MTKNVRSFADVSIAACSGGFGEYQCNRGDAGERWADIYDLKDEMRSNSGADEMFELGVDDLPPSVRDIRGAIHNEPDHVFAFVYDDGHVSYAGIVEN